MDKLLGTLILLWLETLDQTNKQPCLSPLESPGQQTIPFPVSPANQYKRVRLCPHFGQIREGGGTVYYLDVI